MKHASGFNIADDDDVEFYRSKETRRQKNAYKIANSIKQNLIYETSVILPI